MDNLTQNSRLLQEKWAPVLNHEGLPEIKDHYKRAVTAVLLENQEKAIQEQYAVEGQRALLTEASPTSNTGSAADSAGLTGAATGAGARAGVRPPRAPRPLRPARGRRGARDAARRLPPTLRPRRGRGAPAAAGRAARA